MSQCRQRIEVQMDGEAGVTETCYCTDTEGHEEAHSCKIWWSSLAASPVSGVSVDATKDAAK